MANEKKPAAPPKVETINLKVFIHCEGCKKKVRKTLICIEGVHTVEIDESLGKVTVTGTVDSKVLIKKLDKAGKVAEVLPSGGKGKDQKKGENNKDGKDEGKEKKGKNGGAGGDGEGKDNEADDNKGNNNGGGGGKKKKGGGGDGVDELVPIKNTANRNVAPNGIQTGYAPMESAEYATHMFSDENANNCHIM